MEKLNTLERGDVLEHPKYGKLKVLGLTETEARVRGELDASRPTKTVSGREAREKFRAPVTFYFDRPAMNTIVAQATSHRRPANAVRG